MPTINKLLAQFNVIEYLTVEANKNSLIRVCHGLTAAHEINNAQPRVAKPHFVIYKNSLVIRATMRNGRNHALEQHARRY